VGVTIIGEYAFYDCSSLKEITYGGTIEQWKNIQIEIENDPLLNATISTLNDDTVVEFAVCYETVYITADNLYLRNTPSASGTIATIVVKGTEIIRIGYHEMWSKVMYNGGLYYCGSNYLSISPPS
ncbi:MAG: hypothetical protein J6W14_03065, partial [Clostridia bacterium]|nr:hypothetical protein [Clostridia bacterium]